MNKIENYYRQLGILFWVDILFIESIIKKTLFLCHILKKGDLVYNPIVVLEIILSLLIIVEVVRRNIPAMKARIWFIMLFPLALVSLGKFFYTPLNTIILIIDICAMIVFLVTQFLVFRK